MRKHLLGLFCFCCLSALFVQSGCGGSGSSTPPQPLAITSAAPPIGVVSSAYAGSGFALTASGGAPSYSWSWAPDANSSLPPGLTVSNGRIVGTPTTEGTYNVVVTVTDMQSAHVNVSYQMTINTGLAIISVAPPSGAVNIPYGPSRNGFAIAASGGISPYTVSWSTAGSSETPPGLSLTNEKILGTPNTQGSYDVVITVTDSETPATTIDAPYTISIGSVALTSEDPPMGKVGVPFGDCTPGCTNGGFLLAGDGGIPPYSFSWVAAPGSSIPPGLHIGGRSLPYCLSPDPDSEICGNPTTEGIYYVVVTISDSASLPNHGSATYRIFIQP